MYKSLKNRTMEYQKKENLIVSSDNILCLHGILTLEEASQHLNIPQDLVKQIWETGDNTLLVKYVEQNTYGKKDL